LIEADERAHREAEEEHENRGHRRRSRHRNARRRGHGDRVQSELVEAAGDPQAQAHETLEQPAGSEHHDHDVVAHEGHEHEAHDRAQEHAHAHEHHDHEHHGHEHQDDHHDHGHQHGHDHAHEVSAAPDTETQHDPVAAVVEASVASAAREAAEHVEINHEPERVHEEQAEENAAHADDAQPAATDEVHAAGDGHAVAEHAASDEAAPQDTGATPSENGDEDDDEDDGEEAEEDQVESVGGDDVLEEVPERPFRPRRQYKIQEVIKRRQVMLVQVVKEERGNKGAALTTYLSLAGRYAVLMPNTARGGGISRKITSAQDRSRLKEVVQDLDVPEGMGIILRTAGASRSKPEIKRDFEYLIRMWETVRDLTLKSQAPTLVYEEGSLIKRSLRDLYNKEIDEIQVAGDAGYREARDFMKMLMPANVRAVKLYGDGQPLFSRMGVESHLDAMFSPTVQLRSGGYIVINQTEALVSIDVNSGRATREHHIEDTALKTNLEAAEEVARQLRLRDLAGLIVIDFIDMDEKRNNRAVERKLSDCLRQDRARIQVGRISHFGLLEMSRQRIRASVLESSTEPCPQCGGSGHVRSVSSVALQLLRGIEEILMKGATHNLVVRTRTDVALYVLNHKRGHLRDLEDSFKVQLSVVADATVHGTQSYIIDRGEQVHTLEAAKALLAAQAAAAPAQAEEADDGEELFEYEAEVETDETEGLADDQAAGEEAAAEGEGDGQRRKRRRRRRGRGGDREAREAAPQQPREDGDLMHVLPEGTEAVAAAEEAEGDEDEGDEQQGFAQGDQAGNGERRPRRRGRRGGRRRRGGNEENEGLAGSISDELSPTAAPEAVDAVADFDSVLEPAPTLVVPEVVAVPFELRPAEIEPAETVAAPAPEVIEAAVAATEDAPAENDRAARRRSTVREKVSFGASPQPETPAPALAQSPAEEPPPAPAPVAEPAPAAATEAPARKGWWSRRFGGGN
ncbi:MAG: ribonuclease, partial [Bradyrhizobium sp.]